MRVYSVLCVTAAILTVWVNFVRQTVFLSSYEHVRHETVEKFTKVSVTIDLESVRHDPAGQTVTAEQRLHAAYRVF